MAQHATILPEQQTRATSHPRNVGDLERGLSVIGGTALVLCGLRRSLGNLALMLGGGALIYRGLTGYCATYRALGVNTAHRDTGHGVALRATITVHKPVSEVYQFWRHLENHPRFMQHLESVVSTNGKRSHWVAKAPLPAPIEWDTDIVTERENALLSWRSLAGSDIDHAGTVRFRELPNGRGTEVRVRLEYAPPGGMVAVAVANLFKTLTQQQLKEDLRHFKQIIETGETPTADYAKVSQEVSR
jgi:uncharacterized membrane protein